MGVTWSIIAGVDGVLRAFLRDREIGRTTQVSPNDARCSRVMIGGAGRHIAMECRPIVTVNDRPSVVYVKDRVTGAIDVASHGASAASATVNSRS